MALAALLQADPRAAGVATQLRAQQRVLAPRGVIVPPEYIDDLAAQIVAWAAVNDIRGISAEVQTVLEPRNDDTLFRAAWVFHVEGVEPAATWGVSAPYSLALSYIDEGADETGGAVTFSSSTDGRYNYVIRWVADPGVPIFWAYPRPPRQSFLSSIIADFGPLITIAGAFIGLPALIGNAVLGPVAAATYPGIAQAVGSIAMQTALTGGDIERAVKSAAASLVGAQVGDIAGSGLDSALVGKVSAVATTAALSGGDIGTAVGRALVYAGVQKVDDWMDTGSDYVDPWLMGDSGDWLTWDDLGITLDPTDLEDAFLINQDTLDEWGIPFDTLMPDDTGNLTTATGEIVEPTDVTYAEALYVDDQGNLRDMWGTILIEAQDLPTMSQDEIAAAVLGNMSQNEGVTVTPPQSQPVSRPASLPPPAAQGKMPTLTDITKTAEALGKAAATIAAATRAIRTGTYTPPYTTSPNGTPRNTPPGVPIQRPDGSVVTNNGNGTQTVRYPDGRVVTMPSSVTGSTPGASSLLPGVSNQVLLIGGAVLVGAVILARR